MSFDDLQISFLESDMIVSFEVDQFFAERNTFVKYILLSKQHQLLVPKNVWINRFL